MITTFLFFNSGMLLYADVKCSNLATLLSKFGPATPCAATPVAKKDRASLAHIDGLSAYRTLFKNPPEEVIERLKQTNKELWKKKCDYANSEYDNLTSKIKLLKKRLDNLYVDKVDGITSNEFYVTKQNEWKTELDEKVERLNQMEHVDRM